MAFLVERSRTVIALYQHVLSFGFTDETLIIVFLIILSTQTSHDCSHIQPQCKLLFKVRIQINAGSGDESCGFCVNISVSPAIIQGGRPALSTQLSPLPTERFPSPHLGPWGNTEYRSPAKGEVITAFAFLSLSVTKVSHKPLDTF